MQTKPEEGLPTENTKKVDQCFFHWIFPDNKKIYYDNKYNRAIYAFYYVTPRCRYLLTHCNVVRMKMDAVFDQNEIRKELREELTERFELADNYVFRPDDVKQTK